MVCVRAATRRNRAGPWCICGSDLISAACSVLLLRPAARFDATTPTTSNVMPATADSVSPFVGRSVSQSVRQSTDSVSAALAPCGEVRRHYPHHQQRDACRRRPSPSVRPVDGELSETSEDPTHDARSKVPVPSVGEVDIGVTPPLYNTCCHARGRRPAKTVWGERVRTTRRRTSGCGSGQCSPPAMR
ncbi:hypothetical protein T484DRAFT_1744155 [Baffinella frigidus]|nr:hypothetical protein T484DRAFT_1744155 [Cryptophyta sp. CCMP2293]